MAFSRAVAAQIGTADLTFFLLLVVLVMLIANGIYSWLVSKIRESKIMLFICFSLLPIFSSTRSLIMCFPTITGSVSFYVWYNVFNFSSCPCSGREQLTVSTPTTQKIFWGGKRLWLGRRWLARNRSICFFRLPMTAMLLASGALAKAFFVTANTEKLSLAPTQPVAAFLPHSPSRSSR